MKKITYINEVDISNKTVLLRVDYNLSLSKNGKVNDDTRIKQTLPTINYLLKKNNKIIIITYLGRPKQRDPKFSLKPIVEKFHEYFPKHKVKLVSDFLTDDKTIFTNQTTKEILVLENIRFYPQEKSGDINYIKQVASLGQVFVNDAFGQSHRVESTIVGITKFLPSYGGLLLKKEIEMISKVILKPQKPVVAIMGGAKVSSKIHLINKLTEIADYVLIGGALANTFYCAKGLNVGQSFCQYDETESARRLLFFAERKTTRIVLPQDVMIAYSFESDFSQIKDPTIVPEKAMILDIGPQTQNEYATIIAQAKTIIWNGPMGYFENPNFRSGTNAVLKAITENSQAVSIVGGGDTLAAIAGQNNVDKITHLSTGGGAMLEFIEKGTLPGIEALEK